MHKMTDEEWRESVEWTKIVCGCVIKKDQKYLLVQEKQKKAYGLWNLPAGHVDTGESLEEAATREAYEESGFEVKIIREIDIYHESPTNAVKHVFLAEIVGGERERHRDHSRKGKITRI